MLTSKQSLILSLVTCVATVLLVVLSLPRWFAWCVLVLAIVELLDVVFTFSNGKRRKVD